jgi:putative two-component system response regulator
MPDRVRLLLVDDDDHVRSALSRWLGRSGYLVTEADSGVTALQKLEGSPPFAAMLSDIKMPGMTGLELLPRAIAHDPDMAIIMLTAVGDPESAIQCLRLGATDYLIKPVEVEELGHALQYALRKRELEIDRRELEQWLAREVAEKTQELEEQALRVELMSLSILTALVDTAEPHGEGRNHSVRVANLCAHVGAAYGLSVEEIETVRLAARLHDLGRVSILSAGTPAPVHGASAIAVRLLEPLQHHAAMTKIIEHQHERWDGTGTPGGLRGNAIPAGARILAVVNLFDELTEESLGDAPTESAQEALQVLRREAGTAFDPAIIDLVEKVLAHRLAG